MPPGEAEARGHGLVLPAGEQHGREQEPDPDPAHDREGGHGPVGEPGRVEDVHHERHRDDEVEQPVREDGAGDRRPRARPPAQVPGEDRHARELAHAPGQRGVPEQPHAEGGEDGPVRRGRRRDRLLDHRAPRLRADDDREEVEKDGRRHPLPADVPEGALDRADVGAAPDREPDQGRERHENDEKAEEAATRDAGTHRAAARAAGTGGASDS